MLSIYLDSENIKKDYIFITDKKDTNYLKNVHRVKEGSELRVVDGKHVYFTTIESISKFEIKAKITKKQGKHNSSLIIDAGIGLIKNPKMELVIQKLSEIGIDSITPIKMERSVVEGTKKDRWEKIAVESLKQCMRIEKLSINDTVDFKGINFEKYDAIFIPYEKEESKNKICGILNKIKIPKKILFIIGPEGGFSEKEINLLKEKSNVEMFSLGDTIYRAETAAIVVGGILANVYR